MMKHFILRVTTALLFSTSAQAATATPFLDGEQLGVEITALHYPETLTKDLTSGLTNRILVRVVLLSATKPLELRAVEIAVKYDLWDETFQVTTSVDNAVILPRTVRSAPEVLGLLTDLKLTTLFPIHLVHDDELSIKVDVLVNPIDRERMEKIRKWVQENSAYTSPVPSGLGGGQVTTSRSNALFNEIFEQYAAGADVSSVWKETASSKAFKLVDLRNAR